ncbi:hypothetical protein AB0D99_10510 [Streptomyces sp. NPDC047971]
MRPACLDDPDYDCLWDDDADDCPCQDAYGPPARPIETVPTGDFL